MSLFKKFYKQNILKITKETILKPKNKFNLINDVNNSDNNEYIKIKPKYKYFYKHLLNKKLISSQKYNNIKLFGSNKLITTNSKDKIYNKNNSFFNNKTISSNDDILLKLNILKNKIKLNSSKNSYSFNKTNTINNDKNKNNFLYKKIEDYKSRLPSENFRKSKKINNIISRNNTNEKNLIYNIKNNHQKNDIKINIYNRINKVKKEITNIKTNLIKETERSVILSNKKEKDDMEKEGLIKENEKLKKELDCCKKQLEKYKKYRVLYLNLLKKVKTNKKLVKNISLNEINSNGDSHFKNYVNELIDRGKEINNDLNENEMLEKNIKEILSNLE